MRERSESRERNDDWNRDDDDDRLRERNEEEKIPVWTRRRPTGFDVMPEGERSLFLVFCALIVGFFCSLFRENSFVWFCAFRPHLKAASFVLFPVPYMRAIHAKRDSLSLSLLIKKQKAPRKISTARTTDRTTITTTAA
jgi:hypothetical protein